MKACTKCKEVKELSEFNKSKKGLSGVTSVCKSCKSIDVRDRSRTKEGKLKSIYDNQVGRSKTRGDKPPTYTKKQFVDRFINDDVYMYHYRKWVASCYEKDYSPSFDRKNNYKGYSFDNITVMYWFENLNNNYKDIIKGINRKTSKAVIGTNIKTGEEIEFYSSTEAGKNGFENSIIGKCCKGIHKYHKGYTWKYKN